MPTTIAIGDRVHVTPRAPVLFSLRRAMRKHGPITGVVVHDVAQDFASDAAYLVKLDYDESRNRWCQRDELRLMPYRKPKNWIARMRVTRSEEAFEHQIAIMELGFENYVREGLVLLSVAEVRSRLPFGLSMVYGLVHRPPVKEPDTLAHIMPKEGTD